jgi:Outer membrane protein beta-barrel domain
MRTAVLALSILALASAKCMQAQERVDFSVSGGGIFGKDVSQTTAAVKQSAHYSGFFFGSVRYHFNHLHTVELNIGHADTSQIFTLPPDTYRINTSVVEFSGAYVLTPLHDRRVQPFLFAGAGALRWSPGNQYIDQVQSDFGASQQTSLVFLYGGGADYRLWRRLGLRAQYRGLAYRAPNFGVSTFFVGGRDHMAELAGGFVLKF